MVIFTEWSWDLKNFHQQQKTHCKCWLGTKAFLTKPPPKRKSRCRALLQRLENAEGFAKLVIEPRSKKKRKWSLTKPLTLYRTPRLYRSLGPNLLPHPLSFFRQWVHDKENGSETPVFITYLNRTPNFSHRTPNFSHRTTDFSWICLKVTKLLRIWSN